MLPGQLQSSAFQSVLGGFREVFVGFTGFRKIFFRGVREVTETFSCVSKLFKTFQGVSCSFREVLGACRVSGSLLGL